MTTLAIADVHGLYSVLDDILHKHACKGHDLVFLGDYIDRAHEQNGDLNCLNIVRSLTENPLSHGYKSCVALRGNHEDMFIESVEDNDFECWISNGGNIDAVPDIIGHLEWLKNLPLYEQRGEYLFVHAGVKPKVPLDQQDPEDLLWIRRKFLTCEDHGLPWTVVVGHTITRSFEIEYLPGPKILMDCGSFHSGKIGHAVFDC